MRERLRLLCKYYSLGFSYPTEEVLTEGRAIEEELKLPPIIKGWERLSLETLQTEYTRLFISSFPALPCPPYESFYREGLLFGETALEVQDYFADSGIELAVEGEYPDHVAIELEFIYLTGDFNFLQRLKEWLPSFLIKVKEHSTIYGPLAEGLETFLSETDGMKH